MTKKLISLLAILMMAMNAWATGKYTDKDGNVWFTVSTTQEFVEQVEANHNIRLTADIDLSSLPKDGDYLFTKTFIKRISGRNTNPKVNDGRNFALRNRKSDDGKAAIIFKELRDAQIIYLNIFDCDFEGLDTESGLLSEKCYNTTFYNLTFCNCHTVGDVTGYDCDRMGFVAGYAENSHFNNLFFADCTMITDGSKLGLVAGDAKDCEFTLCSSNMGCELWADGNLTSYNSAYVGGFCGYGDNCTFSKCYNFGAVMSDDDRIGGILGYGTKCTITDCKNVGSVMHCKKEGFGRRNYEIAIPIMFGAGIASFAAGYAIYMLTPGFFTQMIQNAQDLSTYGSQMSPSFYQFAASLISRGEVVVANLATTGVTGFLHAVLAPVLMVTGAATVALATTMLIYTLNDPDEMGGIAGTLEGGSSVLRCWNGGPVECGDEDCGGIVGHLTESSVESCYNRTFVKSHGKCTGGIVGYCKKGTVIHNINVGVVDSESTPMDYIVGETSGTCTINNNHYLYDEVLESDSRAFTQEALPSGLIALTMNNELIAAGKEAVWRQNLGEDFYPVNFDETRPIVTSTTNNYSLWQTVRTAEEFYLVVSNPLAQVSIENDLDLSNYIFNLATQAHPFKGVIKGNGHVLKNCHYSTTDEYINGNCALFPYAMDARFENLILDGITISPLNSVCGDLEDMAIFVAHSTRCEYKNITLRNCNILVNSDEDRLRKIAGLVCHSNYDKITDCTIENTCEFQGHVYATSISDAYVAGFAATAINSEFVNCHNAAKIKADDDRVAGIVADITGGRVQSCLNSGQIIGQGELGGIVGIANNAQILKCVNVGGIDNDDNDHDTHRGGIAGYVKGESSLIRDCLNFGYINWSTDEGSGSGCIDGEHEKRSAWGEGNYWYCQFNGTHKSAGDDIYTNEILTGKYALDKGFYQSIDNLKGYCTDMPVPLAAAGTVYSNILCDGTSSYSNKYNSTASHDCQANSFGNCAICGKPGVGSIATTVHIADAVDLMTLSQSVNSGTDYTDHIVCLDNDIDMADYSYVPIGKSNTTPFKGTFDGQGHRIKNLLVKVVDNCAGVFGCTAGTTVIKNLIVDSSCEINATGYGSAGIVGCAARKLPNDDDAIKLTLDCCGNEANVNGETNAAGLIGGVYNAENHQLVWITLTNCYNTGNIKGSGVSGCESAAFIAYGKWYVKVTNCYNTGDIKGYQTNHSLIRYGSNTTVEANNVYNRSGVGYDEKIPISNVLAAKKFYSGEFCYNNLNSKRTDGKQTWYQNLDDDNSFDVTPVPFKTHATVYSDGNQCPSSADYSNKKHTEISTYDEGEIYCSECHKILRTQEPGKDSKGTYLIANKGNLYWFAEKVNSGSTNINGELTTDINLGDDQTMIGTSTNKYSGTFNGNGYTVTVNYNSTANVAALFRYVGTATIQDLTTTGTITTSAKQAAGVVGMAENLTLDRVMSDVVLTTSYPGDSSDAGLVADISNTSTITNCAFVGKLLGEDTSKCSGLIGWKANANVTISNSYVDFAETTVSTDGCKTLARYSDTAPTINNCYYVIALNEAQETQGTQVTADQVHLGDLCNKLNSGNSLTVWTQNLETATQPTFGRSGLHYARTMSNEWGTIVLPYDITYDQNNRKYKLYKLSAADTQKLTFTEYADGTIAAGTPMIVKKMSGDGIDIAPASTFNFSTTITPQNKANASLPIGWTMNGTYTNLTDQKDIYFIAQNKFWWAEDPITIAPFRAWFTVKKINIGYSKELDIVIEDETDGIDLTPALSQGEGVRKYMENGKVVIVRNGKKFNLNGQAIQ